MNVPWLLAATGGEDPALFLARIGGFITWYYVVLAVINGVAAYYLWHYAKQNGAALFWTVVALTFGGVFAPWAATGSLHLPQAFIDASTYLLSGTRGAIIYNVGTFVMLCVMFYFRKFFTKPMVA